MLKLRNVLLDPNPDPGQPGSGGDDKPDQKVQEVLDSAMAPAPPSTVRDLKVNGKNVQVDVSDTAKLDALLQKGLAADEKFEAAATKLKAAEVKAEVADLAEQVRTTGDPDTFRKFADRIGLTKERTEAIIEGAMGDEDEFEEYDDVSTDPGVGRKRDTKEPSKKLATKYEDLDPALQKVVARVHRQELDEIIGAALDGDEQLSYNMKVLNPEGKDTVRELVWDKISHQLARKGGEVTSEMLKEDVMPFVKKVVKGLGGGRSGRLGLGPAPSGDPGVDGPAKEPERVPITDPGYEEYLQKLVAYTAQQEGLASATG